MPSLYVHFDHANTTDNAESIARVTSTESEKKRVKSVHIIGQTNLGKLKPFIERESLIEGDGYIKTGVATLENELIVPVDAELPIGQTFELTLQNVASGFNAALVGYIEYEITA